MIEELDSKNKATEGMRYLAKQLCGRDPMPIKATKKSFLQRLARKG